jgi:hypothetical protein
VIITRDGKPATVLLAPKDEDDLERLILARTPRFQAMLAKSRESMKAGRTTMNLNSSDVYVFIPTPTRSDAMKNSASANLRACAIEAVVSVQRRSVERGTDKISMAEIDAEIKTVRKQRARDSWTMRSR